VDTCNFAVRIEVFTNILQTEHQRGCSICVLTELIDAVRYRKCSFSPKAGLAAVLQSKHIQLCCPESFSQFLLTHGVTLSKPLPLAYAVCKGEGLAMAGVIILG